MTKFFLRWLINALALFVAVTFVPGIHAQSTGWMWVVWMGLLFGLLNALLRPLLKLLTCPLILLTLGLFTLLINTFLFWLAGVAGTHFGIGFTVDGFWPALLGGLVVSVISVVLTMLFKDEMKSHHTASHHTAGH